MANGSGQSSPHVTMNCVELKKREHWATNPLMKNQQEPQEQSEGNSSAPSNTRVLERLRSHPSTLLTSLPPSAADVGSSNFSPFTSYYPSSVSFTTSQPQLQSIDPSLSMRGSRPSSKIIFQPQEGRDSDEGSPSAAQKPIRNGWLARIGRSFSIASKLGKNEAKSKAEVVSKGAVVHKIEQFVKGK